MLDLLFEPAVWASFLSLVVLEVILGVDNIVFISIVAEKLPPGQRRTARLLGLGGALILRIALLFSIAWIIGLTRPALVTPWLTLSWRDLILLAGGLFLIWKASSEIFAEVEGESHRGPAKVGATFAGVVAQIMVLDVVFSIDSVLTAVGLADHIEVMIAAVVVAVLVMMAASEPIARFIAAHPSTKMLALAFLVMIGVALTADGLHHHIERGYIYGSMLFAGFVEALNLARQRRRARAARH